MAGEKNQQNQQRLWINIILKNKDLLIINKINR